MIGLGEDQRESMRAGAIEIARDTLKDAVVEGIEEAETTRARQMRRRGIVGSTIGLGIGAVIGYALRGSETEFLEETELGTEAVEMMPEAAEAVTGTARQRERQRSSRWSGMLSKLAVVTAVGTGIYLLRRRSGSPQEMVQEATQRAREVGEEAEERSEEMGEQTEAVAGGASDRLDEAGERIGEGAAGTGEAVSEGIDDAADVAEDVQEEAEEATDEADEEE